MATKSNIRSFRYSDETAAILEAQPGESLNAKFENLVKFCFSVLDQRKEQLSQIDTQIAARRETLCNLTKATAELAQLEKDIHAAQFSFGIVQRRAAAIAEKAEQL